MKDNFNLEQYLVENKMTEQSRGNDFRVHFGKEASKRKNLQEGCHGRWHKKSMDECDMMDIDLSENKEKDALYREFIGFESKYGRDKATKIFHKFHPDVDIESIIPRYAKRNRAMNDKIEKNILSRTHKRDQFSEDPRWEGDRGYLREEDYLEDEDLDEAGYTDDEEFFDDDTFIGAHGSDADLGIKSDVRAKKAAMKGMKGEFDDEEESEEDLDFVDPEDADDDADVEKPEAAEEAPKAESSSLESLFGKNAKFVEPLVDDLDTYLKGPKGRWNTRVSKVILKRAVEAAKEYLDDFEYPRKGILYLTPNKMGQYDQDIRDTGNAVVAVHRNPVED